MNLFKQMKLHHYLLAIASIAIVSITIYSGILLNDIINANTASSNNDFVKKVIAPVQPLKTPINILLLCGDQSSGNTDTIMLAHFNPVTCEIGIISVPRDTACLINNSIYKINYAYPSGGMTRAYQTVGSLLGTNIDYYAYINTKIFREIVDILGGVDYNVPTNLKYDDKSQNLHIDLKKGMQHLNGRQAEGLVRFRKPNHMRYTKELLKYYDGGDLKRIETQQNFVREIVSQKANVKYFDKMSEIVKSVFSNVKTNMSFNTALRLLFNAKKLNVQNVKTYRISGSTGTYHGLSFVFFDGNLLDTKTQEVASRSEVLAKSFDAEGQLFKTSYSASLGVLSTINSWIKGGGSTTSSSSGTKKPITKATSKPTTKATTKPSTTHSPVATQAPTEVPVVAEPTEQPKPDPTQVPEPQTKTEAPVTNLN